MNSPNIDFAKVQAAVARYAPKATLTKKELKAAQEVLKKIKPAPVQPQSQEKQPPVDAAIRKPLLGRTVKCTGFTHPHFLNNDR